MKRLSRFALVALAALMLGAPSTATAARKHVKHKPAVHKKATPKKAVFDKDKDGDPSSSHDPDHDRM